MVGVRGVHRLIIIEATKLKDCATMRFPLPADWLPFPLIFGKLASLPFPCAFVSGRIVIVAVD